LQTGTDLIKPFLGPEHAATFRANESAMLCFMVLKGVCKDVIHIRGVKVNLIHCSPRRELTIAHWAFETVCGIIVLSSLKQVTNGGKNEYGPESSPPAT
jgi:hypothetical protein